MSKTLFDQIKDNLKTYIGENSAYSPLVTKNATSNVFPKVVIKKADDRENRADTQRFNVISTLTIEIDIYAQDKTVGTKKLSGMTIANEIEEHIKKLMGEYYGFKRIFDQPTPNIDNTVYRITMRYNVNVNERLNQFI